MGEAAEAAEAAEGDRLAVITGWGSTTACMRTREGGKACGCSTLDSRPTSFKLQLGSTEGACAGRGDAVQERARPRRLAWRSPRSQPPVPCNMVQATLLNECAPPGLSPPLRQAYIVKKLADPATAHLR